MLWEAVKLALSSIRRNKLRSVLTLLGIVIGVAAVIAMVTLGSGASSKVRENLAKLGSNMLIARPGQSTFGPGGASDSRAFDERDVAALKANLTGIRGVAPTAQKQAKAVFGALNYDTTRHRHQRRLVHRAGLGDRGRPSLHRRRDPLRHVGLRHRRHHRARALRRAGPGRRAAAARQFLLRGDRPHGAQGPVGLRLRPGFDRRPAVAHLSPADRGQHADQHHLDLGDGGRRHRARAARRRGRAARAPPHRRGRGGRLHHPRHDADRQHHGLDHDHPHRACWVRLPPCRCWWAASAS